LTRFDGYLNTWIHEPAEAFHHSYRFHGVAAVSMTGQDQAGKPLHPVEPVPRHVDLRGPTTLYSATLPIEVQHLVSASLNIYPS